MVPKIKRSRKRAQRRMTALRKRFQDKKTKRSRKDKWSRKDKRSRKDKKTKKAKMHVKGGPSLKKDTGKIPGKANMSAYSPGVTVYPGPPGLRESEVWVEADPTMPDPSIMESVMEYFQLPTKKNVAKNLTKIFGGPVWVVGSAGYLAVQGLIQNRHKLWDHAGNFNQYVERLFEGGDLSIDQEAEIVTDLLERAGVDASRTKIREMILRNHPTHKKRKVTRPVTSRRRPLTSSEEGSWELIEGDTKKD
jgi:hypothetical protein